MIPAPPPGTDINQGPVAIGGELWELICKCGDWASDHPDGGRCRICGDYPIKPLRCRRFKPSGIEHHASLPPPSRRPWLPWARYL